MELGSISGDFNTLAISKMMELTHERQRVIANNIANVNTPGFIRREYKFEDELARVIASKSSQEMSELKGVVVKDLSSEPRLDGNSVKSAKEMNLMMQNGIFYNLLSRAYNTKLNILKTAIGGF